MSSSSYEEDANNIELEPLIVGQSQIFPDYFNTPQTRKQVGHDAVYAKLEHT
jgi:hypothetical protein